MRRLQHQAPGSDVQASHFHLPAHRRLLAPATQTHQSLINCHPPYLASPLPPNRRPARLVRSHQGGVTSLTTTSWRPASALQCYSHDETSRNTLLHKNRARHPAFFQHLLVTPCSPLSHRRKNNNNNEKKTPKNTRTPVYRDLRFNDQQDDTIKTVSRADIDVSAAVAKTCYH